MADLIKITSTLKENEFNKIAETYAKSAVKSVAEEVQRQSLDRCPVDTGNLKGSNYIQHKSKSSEVGYKAKYALYVEHMPQSSLSKTGHGGKAHFLSGCLEKSLRNGLKNMKKGGA